MFEGVNKFKSQPNLKTLEFPPGTNRNNLEYITIHKVFTQGDDHRAQLFDEVPPQLDGKNFRLVAITCDNYEVQENSSVGINFCVEVNSLGKGRLVPLNLEFPSRVYFQRVPYFDVLHGKSLEPKLYFLARQSPGVLNTLSHFVKADKNLNLNTRDYLRSEAIILDNGSKIGIPASLKSDFYPRNYVGYYLEKMKYQHPIKCIETPSYREPNGGKGFILPIEHFEEIADDVFKSLGDPRPIYNFSQFALQVSPTVKYFSITLTIFYTLL